MSKVRLALCYVKDQWAYFTSQALDKQWGDDWDDAPYEYNAEPPYTWDVHRDVPEYYILKVAFDGEFLPPDHGHHNSPWSVKSINAGGIAWLRPADLSKTDCYIPAGTDLQTFIEKIQQGGGRVYIDTENIDAYVPDKGEHSEC